MKRLVLFVVALVFAFCTTVMAADQMAPASTTAPAEKAAPAKKDMKKADKKKATKKAKKADKKEMKKDDAAKPRWQNKSITTLCDVKKEQENLLLLFLLSYGLFFPFCYIHLTQFDRIRNVDK